MSADLITKNRFVHLDSLRGIAALAVCLYHCMIAWKGPDELGINALLGPCSVLFFFVLSGFVLGRSLEKNPVTNIYSYLSYLVRRIFRLYPAIFITLIIFTLINLYHAPYIPLLGEHAFWYGSDNNILENCSASWILKEIFLIKVRICPVMWSLQAEFLCSFLLPLIVTLTLRNKNLYIPLLILFAFFMAPIFSGISFYYPYNLLGGSRISYFFAFYVGYFVNKFSFCNSYINPFISKWVLVLIMLTIVPIGSCYRFFNADFSSLQISVVIVFSVFLAIMVPCNITPLRKFLLRRPLVILGQCSYSFYLLHCVGIFFGLWIMHLWMPGTIRHPVMLPVFVLFILTLLISIPLAVAMEYVVERPFNRWGHLLSKKIQKHLPIRQ